MRRRGVLRHCLANRITDFRNVPSAVGLDHLDQSGLAEIEALLQARLPVYEATADHVVSTADRSVEEVVEAILELLGAIGHATEKS